MDLEKKVKNSIKKYKLFEKKEKLVLAVSGGVDSVVLLNALNNLGYRLVIAHLNHFLRGKDSEQDQKFVKQLAQKYGLEFETKKIDIKNIAKQKKANLEETAREERYKFLENVAKKHKATKIITAHHADDYVETILLNYLRGAGPKGLSGMGYVSSLSHVTCHMLLVRPMLNVWRKDIESYQKKNNLEFRQDKSNFDTKIKRNYLRLKLIPALEKKDKNFKKKIWNQAQELKELSVFLEPKISKIYAQVLNKSSANFVILDAFKLRQLENNLQAEILRKAIKSLLGDLKDVSREHIISTLKALKTGFSGKTIIFPKKLRVILDYDKVVLFKGKFSASKVKKRLLKIGKNRISECNLDVNLNVADKLQKNIFNFDFNKIDFPIFARSVVPGDKFIPYGFRGTKKIQDIFVDNKVPQRLRRLIPIIVDKNNNILGILGMNQSNKAIIDKKSKKILTINYKKA